MPVIYKSKGDYIPFVDLYGAGTLDMLKTNLLLKVFQKTKDKYCNFTFGCGWDDETWGVGVYYGTSIVVSTRTDNREFFIVFYPSESSPGLNLLGTAYLLDGRTPVYIRYIERDGAATWHIENVNKNENNICQTVVGTKNYTGHQINSGEYFIANGEKYKATAAIPNGSSWQGSATAVSDHDLINALNSNITTLNSKFEKRTAITAVNITANRTLNDNMTISGGIPSGYSPIAFTPRFIAYDVIIIPIGISNNRLYYRLENKGTTDYGSRTIAIDILFTDE